MPKLPKILQSDVMIEVHPADGFTLSIRIDNDLFKRRYIGYSKWEAMQEFLPLAKEEAAKQ